MRADTRRAKSTANGRNTVGTSHRSYASGIESTHRRSVPSATTATLHRRDVAHRDHATFSGSSHERLRRWLSTRLRLAIRCYLVDRDLKLGGVAPDVVARSRVDDEVQRLAGLD